MIIYVIYASSKGTSITIDASRRIVQGGGCGALGLATGAWLVNQAAVQGDFCGMFNGFYGML